jgi:hypothetical protein
VNYFIVSFFPSFVASENMPITSPSSHERLDSPVTVTGAGMAFEGQIGVVRVLEHLYTEIGLPLP